MTDSTDKQSPTGDLQKGQEVTWYQQRRWGGKQAVPAIFLEYRGAKSARIDACGVLRTVSIQNIHAV